MTIHEEATNQASSTNRSNSADPERVRLRQLRRLLEDVGLDGVDEAVHKIVRSRGPRSNARASHVGRIGQSLHIASVVPRV